MLGNPPRAGRASALRKLAVPAAAAGLLMLVLWNFSAGSDQGDAGIAGSDRVYSAGGIPTPIRSDQVCDAATRDANAADFRALHDWVVASAATHGGGWSFGCYSEESVLPALWSVAPAKDLVYVDVGANKGQSLASVLRLWTDVSFHFVMALSDKPPACFFDMTVPRIYAVEPGAGNIELLNELKTRLPTAVAEGISVEHAALSGDTGFACMQGDQGRGNERATIDPSPAAVAAASSGDCPEGHWKVQTYTVEDWMAARGVSHINYLKIDTEGFDSLVVDGALSALRQGKIDMLSYEYHEIGMWGRTSLQAVTQKLDDVGYDSYFIGDFHLYKMSNGCWDDVFEIRKWSNVLAVRRDYEHHDELLREFPASSCKHRDLAFICTRFDEAA